MPSGGTVLSQNGFTADPPLTTITVNGCKAQVRKGNVAKLLRWYGVAYNELVEPVRTISGYRSAAGNAATGTPVSNSNHRSATAIDINGGLYPYEYTHRAGWKNTMSATKQRAVRKILKKIPELRWGADFASPYRDPMHVEVAPGVTDAQIGRRLVTLGYGHYEIVKGTARSKTRVALYKRRAIGKKNITRHRKVGKTVLVVAIVGRWAVTAHGDWIKRSKIKKAK